ncbi:hypothetical protein ASE01_22505 [Nocardioides sp. Root190]|uniref:hypothetical protein n=1 Tax=Nocardioides sp. Root190 TaxID=1736488 RepID=UPI0006F82B80|nr:hypothetical protein [Nocardioides sp. Root190]KRB72810.1 hypothetical protein ASE01_22505 [Nocardioides sp. Root190]
MSVTLAIVTMAALGGCSDAGEEPSVEPTSTASEAVEPVDTDAALGKVQGRLDTAAAQSVVTEVTAVVDSWIDGGLGGDYPRTDFGDGFSGFTEDARALAEKRSAVLTNADLGADLGEVELVERVVRVDVAAPKGRPVGATARVRVRLVLDGDRTDVVSGRLLLTPTAEGWQVFGFDLARGQEGA